MQSDAMWFSSLLLLTACSYSQSAPTGCRDLANGSCCEPTICKPGQYPVPCEEDKTLVSACQPCPNGTFSHEDSSLCKPWKSCNYTAMIQLSPGNATTDAVCACKAGFVLVEGGRCTEAGTLAVTLPEGNTSKPNLTVIASQMSPVGKTASQLPGWAIILIVTISFLSVMGVFWFWMPCLRGEPDYDDGDDMGVGYVMAEGEADGAVTYGLSESDNYAAVAYSVNRLPVLLTQEQSNDREFLKALFRNGGDPSLLPLLDSLDDEPAGKRLTTCLKAWYGRASGPSAADALRQGDTSDSKPLTSPARSAPAGFQALLKALRAAGNHRSASVLKREVAAELRQKDHLMEKMTT